MSHMNLRRLAPALVSVVFLLVGACASIVKKPEINQVRKAAIVSLYANDKVPKSGTGSGVVTGWDQTFKRQVAGNAIRIFSAEMTRMGWKMVNPDKIVQSSEYQAAFKPKAVPGVSEDSTMGKALSFVQNTAMTLRDRAFFTPSGMHPIQLDDKSSNTTYYGDAARTNPKALLAKWAKALGVDAVVLVQLDYCYTGGTYSMLGTGEAVITAATSVKAVNQAGEMIINMPTIQECGGERFESKGTATMISGNLMFAKLAHDGFGKMFTEATTGAARDAVTRIRSAMN